MPLITAPNLSAPDDFYEALLSAHQDLSEAESHAFNARLILLLANHIGQLEVLKAALAAAGASSAGAIPTASASGRAFESESGSETETESETESVSASESAYESASESAPASTATSSNFTTTLPLQGTP